MCEIRMQTERFYSSSLTLSSLNNHSKPTILVTHTPNPTFIIVLTFSSMSIFEPEYLIYFSTFIKITSRNTYSSVRSYYTTTYFGFKNFLHNFWLEPNVSESLDAEKWRSKFESHEKLSDSRVPVVNSVTS